MFKLITSSLLLLNIYALPLSSIEKASDYTKKMERVELDSDLKKINNRFFDNRVPLSLQEALVLEMILQNLEKVAPSILPIKEMEHQLL